MDSDIFLYIAIYTCVCIHTYGFLEEKKVFKEGWLLMSLQTHIPFKTRDPLNDQLIILWPQRWYIQHNGTITIIIINNNNNIIIPWPIIQYLISSKKKRKNQEFIIKIYFVEMTRRRAMAFIYYWQNFNMYMIFL